MTFMVWAPLSVLRSRFFVFPKKNKKSSSQAGVRFAQQKPTNPNQLSIKLRLNPKFKNDLCKVRCTGQLQWMFKRHESFSEVQ